MTAITIGTAAANVSGRTAATKKGFWARAYAAFVAARMRQAEREIGLHSHLLPGELQRVSECLSERSEKELPFAR